MDKQGDPLGIVPEIEIEANEQMAYAQARIRPRKCDAQNVFGFRDKNRLPNLGQTTRPGDSQQKGEPAELWILLFRLTIGSGVKESEKKDKYLDFAREVKKTMEEETDSDTNCNWCVR